MKKALLTTTALVALNSAAFASSIDTPVNSASSTHHTHSAATIVWTGDANIKYNVPLKATAGQSVDGVVASDVDLDVTMTSPGAYSATISAGIEGGALEKLGPNATVTVTTPMFNVSVGTDDAAGGAELLALDRGQHGAGAGLIADGAAAAHAFKAVLGLPSQVVPRRL